MNRPSPGDLTRLLDAAQRLRYHDELEQVDAAIARGDLDGARSIVGTLQPDLGGVFGFQDFAWALEPDAYWRHATWRRFVAIAAGPAVNLVFAVVLFTAVYLVAAGGSTTVARVLNGSPAAAAGVHSGDRIVRLAGQKVDAGNLSSRIRSTKGHPFVLRVERNGRLVSIGPLRATQMDGVYRIGIEEHQGSGEPLPAAARDSFRLTWEVVKDTVVGIAHLSTGRDTNQVSGPVGIVRASAAGWRDGASTFLYVLGLISLALGLLNLLPVLPLDGGHIVMALVEKVRGRTFTQAVYIRYSVIGLTLFMVLMYLGLRNDLFGG
jgi:regulator of sigma E protease